MVAIAVLADTTYARVRVTITGAVSSDVMVYRIGTDNQSVPVRNADPAFPISGVAEIYDYEAPFNSPVTYRVDDNGTIANSSSVTLNVTKSWLRSPHFPSLNVIVSLVEHPELARERPQGVHRVLGRRRPIVVSGQLSSKQGTLRLLTGSEAAGDALSEFFDLTDVGYLQVPNSRLGSRYYAFGNVSESPVTRFVVEDTIRWEIGITEVDRPTGGFEGNPTATYDSLKDGTIPNYTNLKTVKTTYLEVMRGVGIPTTPPSPGTF